MPKNKSKLRRDKESRWKICIKTSDGDQISLGKSQSGDDVKNDDGQLNNLNSIAVRFPRLIQNILSCVSTADQKSLRLSCKSLQTAVDRYIGLDFILSDSLDDCSPPTQRVRMINWDLLQTLQSIGIRNLIGIKLVRTKFVELLPHSFLLQSVQLVGQVDQHILVGLLRECWSLQSIKLQECNPFQKLVTGNFFQFVRSITAKKSVRLERLRCLNVLCSTTSTVGYMLIILSVLEAERLQDLQFTADSMDPEMYFLISAILLRLVNQCCSKTLHNFGLIVDSGQGYPDVVGRRRFLKRIAQVEEDLPQILPAAFHDALGKLEWGAERRNEWLGTMLNETGAGGRLKLSTLRLEIESVQLFTNHWFHTAEHQHALHVLELQTGCHWGLVGGVVGQNAHSLERISLTMRFDAGMNLPSFFQHCTNVKTLTLKAYEYEAPGYILPPIHLTGHLTNAKFDQVFPRLEGLVLSNLLIRSEDFATLLNLKHLKHLMISPSNLVLNENMEDPPSMYGLLYEDFLSLLHRRSLKHLIVGVDAIEACGPLEKRIQDWRTFHALVDEPMFHRATVFDWEPNMRLDEDYIVVAHLESISVSDWFFPFLMSVVDDQVAGDALWARSMINR